jgi:hypothetical protein
MIRYTFEAKRRGTRVAIGTLMCETHDDAFLMERLLNASGEIRVHIDEFVEKRGDERSVATRTGTSDDPVGVVINEPAFTPPPPGVQAAMPEDAGDGKGSHDVLPPITLNGKPTKKVYEKQYPNGGTMSLHVPVSDEEAGAKKDLERPDRFEFDDVT